MAKDKKPSQGSPEWVEEWVKDCGFDTYEAAAIALETPARTFWRWKAEGLPTRSHGIHIVKAMEGIRRARMYQKNAG